MLNSLWMRIVLFFSLISFLLVCCKDHQPIKIGFVGGLSGKMSELAISGRNGAILAVEEINQAGGVNGHPIQLVVRNDWNTPEGALAAVIELHKEKVPVIIGHYISGANIGSFDYINQNKILMISPTVRSTLFSNRDDYFFRIITPLNVQAKMLAEVAVNKKIKTMAVVYEKSNKIYGEEFYRFFAEKYLKMGGKIIFIRSFISGPQSDVFKIAKAAAASNPQGILMLADGIDTAIFMQKLSHLKPDVPVLTGSWCMTNDFIQYGGDSLSRVIIASDYSVDDKSNHDLVSFKEKYKKRFGVNPTFSSSNSYDAVLIIFLMLKTNPHANSEYLRQFLRENKIFHGVQGEIRINDSGDMERKQYLYQVQGDGFQKIEK